MDHLFKKKNPLPSYYEVAFKYITDQMKKYSKTCPNYRCYTSSVGTTSFSCWRQYKERLHILPINPLYFDHHSQLLKINLEPLGDTIKSYTWKKFLWIDPMTMLLKKFGARSILLKIAISCLLNWQHETNEQDALSTKDNSCCIVDLSGVDDGGQNLTDGLDDVVVGDSQSSDLALFP